MKRLTVALCLFIAGLLFIPSCKKSDALSRSASQATVEQFLDLPSSTLPGIDRIVQTISKQNAAHPFLDQFIKNEGLPLWSKPNIHLQHQNGSNIPDTIVLVPVVRQRDSIVSAFLACRVSSNFVSIRFIRDRDYKNFSFEENKDSVTANQIAMELMAMQKNVFGDSSFVVNDNRLFNYRNKTGSLVKPSRVILRSSSPQSNGRNTTMIYLTYEECYNIVYEGDQGQLVGVAPGGTNDYSYMTTQCYTTTVVIDGGGGGDATGDGLGGSTGGGGSGGGFYDGGSNPCPVSRVEKNNIAATPDGCQPATSPSPTDANGYYYSRINTLNSLLSSYRFALINCDSLNLMPLLGYGPMYQAVAQYHVPQSVLNRVDSVRNVAPTRLFDAGFSVQSLNNAYGDVVNCDFFPVRITQLPKKADGTTFTPRELVEYFRTNINNFVTITSPVQVSFNPYNDGPNLFSGGNFSDADRFNAPYENSLGVLLHIHLIDDGSVVESDYSHIDGGSYIMDQFKFSTIHSPLDGDHPVSGNRQFGIYSAASTPGEYTFFTMGVDRATNLFAAIGSQLGGFESADALWTNVQENFISFVNHTGHAEFYSNHRSVARPRWDVLKDYLKGYISLDELKLRMGC